MSTCSKTQTLAFGYVRLSKEDSNIGESESVSNQRRQIEEFVNCHSDITLMGFFVDDGYSGTNYERPGFKALLAELEKGKANCVIVKDMSRLGREYIQTGMYMQRLFPQMGVRFISINDRMDSSERNQSDDILIPIKNLMNDSYCLELSRKLRTQFRMQRRNGEFMGAFAAFGYLKSPDDKHKLMIDENAAEVVKGIFSLKLQGYSQQKIAEQLNKQNILSPAAYKRMLGMSYQTSFGDQEASTWSAVSVLRVLRNRIYVGDLIQGKRFRPNYKVKKTALRRQEDWAVVPNAHAAIIDPWVFEAVQRALDNDTRCTDRSETVAPLSGMVFCGDCGQPMIQHFVTRSGKRFYYYVCKGSRMKNGCTCHNISIQQIEKTVLSALQAYISSVLDVHETLEKADNARIQEAKVQNVTQKLLQKQANLEQNRLLKDKLYEHLAAGFLEEDEYYHLKAGYTKQIALAETAIAELEREREMVMAQFRRNQLWITHFQHHQSVERLNRETALLLIQRVEVYEDKRLEIEFACQDEYQAMSQLAEAVQEVV